MFFTEVARVVQHHVEQHLHAPGMGLVDKRLERCVTALVAVVNAAEVAGMVAVIVKARGVLHNRGDPHSREAQRLDIV